MVPASLYIRSRRYPQIHFNVVLVDLGPCKTHVGYLLDCTFQIANIQLSRLDLILNLMLIMLMTTMMTMMILLTRMTSVSNSAGVRIFKFCFRVVTPPGLPPCASPPYHYHQ